MTITKEQLVAEMELNMTMLEAGLALNDHNHRVQVWCGNALVTKVIDRHPLELLESMARHRAPAPIDALAVYVFGCGTKVDPQTRQVLGQIRVLLWTAITAEGVALSSCQDLTNGERIVELVEGDLVQGGVPDAMRRVLAASQA